MEKDKKSLSVQVNDRIYQQLSDLSAEYGASIATVIRMIIVDYLKRYKNYSVISEEGKEDK